MQQHDPLLVRKLRIHLANNHIITREELGEIAGRNLVVFMIHEGMPESSLDEELGDYWNCRDLARWMREHSVLAELYVEGKRLKNPSGRTSEDNERARQRKLHTVA